MVCSSVRRLKGTHRQRRLPCGLVPLWLSLTPDRETHRARAARGGVHTSSCDQPVAARDAKRPVGQCDTTGRLPGRSACPQRLGVRGGIATYFVPRKRAHCRQHCRQTPSNEPIALPPGRDLNSERGPSGPRPTRCRSRDEIHMGGGVERRGRLRVRACS
jgi:hypothetical protein